ncbi:MAG: hypothetical protein A3F72_08835 [Bacteroidetes bacterium RIFCSPLOWO2_12_FULL_35_15]|nr:MAG: hypothetical protein A3F72_08835 [Bacteroidetes bacterium RIFCSPLOWO2_12_FULL_35_15]
MFTKKIGHLKTTLNQLSSISPTNLLPLSEVEGLNLHIKTKSDMKKIFISHSSKDSDKVNLLRDLIEGMGIKDSQIFYSSHPAHGVGLGENIFERLKRELTSDVFVLFILTDNFYSSPVCLCEMGATWIMTKEQVPILIPPFDFSKVQGVFPNALGFYINDKSGLNNLKIKLEQEFNLDPINPNRWEDKRDKFLMEINRPIRTDIEKAKIIEMEKRILAKLNPEKRISRTELKEILGYDPQKSVQVGKIRLKEVYLNPTIYEIIPPVFLKPFP